MPRPTTKEALLQLANDNFEKLWQLIDSMPEEALSSEFDFISPLAKAKRKDKVIEKTHSRTLHSLKRSVAA